MKEEIAQKDALLEAASKVSAKLIDDSESDMKTI